VELPHGAMLLMVGHIDGDVDLGVAPGADAATGHYVERLRAGGRTMAAAGTFVSGVAIPSGHQVLLGEKSVLSLIRPALKVKYLWYNTAMTIAVISDLHDNVAAWQSIVKYLNKEKILFLINCGDTAAPAMLKEMSSTYHGHIDTVFGNVADRETETTIAKDLPNVTHHGDKGTVTIDGQKIFFNHYRKLSEQTALSGDVEIACYGHDHTKHVEKKGNALLINPGTAGGMFQYPSFAVIDLQTMKCLFIEITV
jgi:putative phosphoesterase